MDIEEVPKCLKPHVAMVTFPFTLNSWSTCGGTDSFNTPNWGEDV